MKENDPVREELFGHGHLTEISSETRSLREELREVWAYRDLLKLLIQRASASSYFAKAAFTASFRSPAF